VSGGCASSPVHMSKAGWKVRLEAMAGECGVFVVCWVAVSQLVE
jgi:hypothetical protein